MDFVSRKDLMRGLKTLSLAGRNFEPIAPRGISSIVADKLVALGLAQRGECRQRMQELGYETGYRLTMVGWKARFNKALFPKP